MNHLNIICNNEGKFPYKKTPALKSGSQLSFQEIWDLFIISK